MKKPKKREDNKVEYGTISLPLPLINKIKERINKTGISSVSGYVTFVLREILSSSKKDSGERIGEVKRKLKKLGYSD